jgi:hypothetical protein
MRLAVEQASNEQIIMPTFSEKVLPAILDDDDIHSMIPGQFRKDKYEIKIGLKSIDFDLNDKIFSLESPNLDKVFSKSCTCCQKEFKSKHNECYCDFCGARSCEKCIHRTREFKNSSIQGVRHTF